MSDRKKIYAIISYPFLPATTGGEISTMQILQFMGKQHQVKVFTVEPYKEIDRSQFSFELDFAMRFKPTRYINPFLLFTILKGIKAMKADYIFFDQPFMGWMIPFIQGFTGKKVFIRSNNIEYLRFRSVNKWWWWLMFLYERMVYRSADLVIFVSDVDQLKAIEQFAVRKEKTLLTPYGITQEVMPEPIRDAKKIIAGRHGFAEDKKILLFFATLNYKPNYDAVDFIVSEIEPRLSQLRNDFVFLICGKHLPEEIRNKILQKQNIQYLGFVEDIETYIDAADAMVNPILSGGGVKTKAIDTLGRGNVVISTKTGAEGIDPGVCGNNLQVANDNDWQALTQLIHQQLDSVKPVIPEAFYKTYSWAGIIRRLSEKLVSS